MKCKDVPKINVSINIPTPHYLSYWGPQNGHQSILNIQALMETCKICFYFLGTIRKRPKTSCKVGDFYSLKSIWFFKWSVDTFDFIDDFQKKKKLSADFFLPTGLKYLSVESWMIFSADMQKVWLLPRPKFGFSAKVCD